MTTYQWLCLLGVPSLLSAAVGFLANQVRKNKADTDAVRLGVQALLRDRLLQTYNYHVKLGYAPFAARENFQNLYNQYEVLGPNGVMTDVYKKFLELPMEAQHEQTSKDIL